MSRGAESHMLPDVVRIGVVGVVGGHEPGDVGEQLPGSRLTGQLVQSHAISPSLIQLACDSSSVWHARMSLVL